MIVIGGSAHNGIGQSLAKILGVKFYEVEHKVFPDGESYIRIPVDVMGEDVVLVQSTYYPQDKHVMELLLMLEALRGKEYALNEIGSMMQFFIGVKEVKNSAQARQARKDVYLRFHEEARKAGVFVAPSQFEAVFTSAVHTEEIMKEYSERIRRVLAGLSW